MRKNGKQLLSLLLCFALALTLLPAAPAQAAGDVAINATNFPDANFRAYVKENFDTDGNGKLSASEIAAVTYIVCPYSNIASLQGVEYFTALTELYCGYNQLTALDLSKNTALTELYCGGNQLTTLNVSKNTKLTKLWCFENKISKLDVSTCPQLVEQLQSAEGYAPWDGSGVIYGEYTEYSGGISLDKGLRVDLNTVLTPAPAHPLVTKPTITTQPKNVSVKAGESVSFTVKASGENLQYQWYYLEPGATKWTKVLKNGTSATYTLTTKERHNGYTYTCKVWNDAGQVWSGNAKLTVASGKPTITSQPKNTSVAVGANASFTVKASGENLNYQWYYQEPGATKWTKVLKNGTSATYTLTTKERHNGYVYTCKVWNEAGKVWSGDAKLTVTSGKPTITSQPKNTSVAVGANASFTVKASGENLNYQWYYQKPGTTSWSKVSVNGTSATYTLTTKERHNGYVYTCKVWNEAGKVWSGDAVLTVTSGKPTITTQPKSVTAAVGETVSFTVKASGENLNYQWYYQKPGTTAWSKVYTNGTSATYTLTAKERHNGYLYTCKVYNDAGAVWSEDAVLTVTSVKPTPVPGGDYVLNTSTMKIHVPSCSSVKDINNENRQDVHGRLEDFEAQGYTPCKRCNPQ